MLSRREFFKVTGAATLMAAIPAAALPSLPKTITLNNIPVGSTIGIFTADTMEQIYLGKTEEQTVTVQHNLEEPRDIIIRIRRQGYVYAQYTANNAKGLTFHHTPIIDREFL